MFRISRLPAVAVAIVALSCVFSPMPAVDAKLSHRITRDRLESRLNRLERVVERQQEAIQHLIEVRQEQNSKNEAAAAEGDSAEFADVSDGMWRSLFKAARGDYEWCHQWKSPGHNPQECDYYAGCRWDDNHCGGALIKDALYHNPR